MPERDYEDFMVDKGVDLVFNKGYTIGQLKDMPYFAGNWPVLQLVLDGLGAEDLDYVDDDGDPKRTPLVDMFKGDAILEDAGVMVSRGYSVEILRYLGYSVADLVDHVTKNKLSRGGFSKKAIEVGFVLAKSGGEEGSVDVRHYFDKHYPAEALHSAGFGALELKDAGYELDQLKDAAYTMHELKEAEFDPALLVDLGHGDPELLAAGYSKRELDKAHQMTFWQSFRHNLCFWRH